MNSTIFVLLVVTQVHNGAQFSAQEFNSLQACSSAAAQVQSMLRNQKTNFIGVTTGQAVCVPKGAAQ